MRTELGIAPLTDRSLSALDFVKTAAAAGFDATGVRVFPVTADDPVLEYGSTEFDEVRRAVADTGIRVLDIEVCVVEPGTERDFWRRGFEMGAQLGASYVNIVGRTPDAGLFASKLAELTADAHEVGLQPVLETVNYTDLNSFDTAVRLAREVGCQVELDALHFLRTGATVELIAENADLFPIFQLCDAPAVLTAADGGRPSVADEIEESRHGRLMPGDGDAPIRELLRLLPDDAWVSVEVVNARLRAQYDAQGYMEMLLRECRSYLSTVAV
ncbi:sugar phosphate isomerase/epimerase family protein [Ruicaihuangia caeni]|uniref:sugar phosphate isomerase/epimerase family protein n=1 Tax=Ruicaihuangia caeni TaxID=3042517 RepID=UPI00338F9169